MASLFLDFLLAADLLDGGALLSGAEPALWEKLSECVNSLDDRLCNLSAEDGCTTGGRAGGDSDA